MKSKRAYRMNLRAEAVEDTRERILKASFDLWTDHHYDEISLEQVAERAGVTKQTVIRQFGSKDQLIVATVDWHRPREEAAREVKPGDVKKAVSVVIDRYEAMGDANVSVLELER